jgi:predicted RNA-binding protein with PIN domain
MPELAAALDSGDVPPAADPVDLATAAYLLRPEGWPGLVAGAADRADDDQAVAAVRQAHEEVERLRRQLVSVTEELKESRAKGREQLAALKQENSELRHKLNDARSRAKAAEAARAEAEASAGEVTAAASAASGAAEAETRRLRSRIEQLEREASAARRSDRSGKDSETLRARLLLDSVLEAAQGLRRELALPPVEGAPADSVEAHEAELGTRSHSGHASMAPDDPALLDQLLALPRAHLIVDGYNVTKTAWPELSLEKQRDRLLGGIAPLAARTRAEVTVVFDAAETRDRPVVNKPRGVRVLFSQAGVIADDLIRDLVAVEPTGRAVVVVTSDRQIVTDVLKAGFRVATSAALARLLSRG